MIKILSCLKLISLLQLYNRFLKELNFKLLFSYGTGAIYSHGPQEVRGTVQSDGWKHEITLPTSSPAAAEAAPGKSAPAKAAAAA